MMFGAKQRNCLAGVAAVVLSAGCASGSETGEDADEDMPHGYVEGAEETAEPQWRLVTGDLDSVRLLDPVSEEVVDVGAAAQPPQAAATDGRFAFVAGDDAISVVDSGVWTVDHGDHVHYYRAQSQLLDSVDGFDFSAAAPELSVAGDAAVTVLAADGEIRVLDRPALEDGDVAEVAALAATAAVPYEQRLVAVGADDSQPDVISVLDRDAEVESHLDVECPDAAGQALTARGVVFGCADGAVLIDADFNAEKIDYPDDSGRVEGGFGHRADTALLAAESADGGLLILDVANAEWIAVGDEPVVALSATGEDSPVLAVFADGVMRSYDPESGEQLAEHEFDGDFSGSPDPTIQVDPARAYVSDPQASVIHEIDYLDDLRLARSFELDFQPDYLVETGW